MATTLPAAPYWLACLQQMHMWLCAHGECATCWLQALAVGPLRWPANNLMEAEEAQRRSTALTTLLTADVALLRDSLDNIKMAATHLGPAAGLLLTPDLAAWLTASTSAAAAAQRGAAAAATGSLGAAIAARGASSASASDPAVSLVNIHQGVLDAMFSVMDAMTRPEQPVAIAALQELAAQVEAVVLQPLQALTAAAGYPQPAAAGRLPVPIPSKPQEFQELLEQVMVMAKGYAVMLAAGRWSWQQVLQHLLPPQHVGSIMSAGGAAVAFLEHCKWVAQRHIAIATLMQVLQYFPAALLPPAAPAPSLGYPYQQAQQQQQQVQQVQRQRSMQPVMDVLSLWLCSLCEPRSGAHLVELTDLLVRSPATAALFQGCDLPPASHLLTGGGSLGDQGDIVRGQYAEAVALNAMRDPLLRLMMPGLADALLRVVKQRCLELSGSPQSSIWQVLEWKSSACALLLSVVPVVCPAVVQQAGSAAQQQRAQQWGAAGGAPLLESVLLLVAQWVTEGAKALLDWEAEQQQLAQQPGLGAQAAQEVNVSRLWEAGQATPLKWAPALVEVMAQVHVLGEWAGKA
jgi:hypothetical protein